MKKVIDEWSVIEAFKSVESQTWAIRAKSFIPDLGKLSWKTLFIFHSLYKSSLSKNV